MKNARAIFATMLGAALLLPASASAMVDSPIPIPSADPDPARSNSPDSAQFAAGTRAINEGHWPQAVAIFSDVANLRGDHADGALYWKAYAENKQGQPDRALSTCAGLRSAYPHSRWIEECGALEIEMRSRSGQPTAAGADETDETKLLALNSMMRQDESHALPQIQEILTGSYSETFKERAIFILALGRSPAAHDMLAKAAQGQLNSVSEAVEASAARLLRNAKNAASDSSGASASPAHPAGGSADAPMPTLKMQTRAVVVDVVVTKDHEDLVGGLQKQDFQVMEDGKPQSIDYFEEHTERILPLSAVMPLPQMPPNVYSNVPPLPEGDSVNVLLLDSLNTDKEDQVYVHQQIIQFLRNMQPGTRVAIFTLASRLRMVQGFTTDSTDLHDALNDPKHGFIPTTTPLSHSVQEKIEDSEHLGTMEAMLGGHSDAGVEAVSSFQADLATFKNDERVGMTLEAMEQLARYLAAVPGRKNLIWFSSSFPIAIFPRMGQKQNFAQLALDSQREYGDAVRRTADLLTVSKVAVYPVGAEGVMTEHTFEANVGGPTDYEGGAASSNARPSSDPMPAHVNENAARADKLAAMEQLAADTGGHAYYNTNDLNSAMRRAIQNGANYYTISYSPTNKKMDGQYRHIEIKVASGKYKLAYRRGYNADTDLMTAGKPSVDPLQLLMGRGLPSSTQVLYGVRVTPASPQPDAAAPRAGKKSFTGPSVRMSADFMIRWSDIHLESAPDQRRIGKIRVVLITYDRDGKAINWTSVTQGMAFKPEVFAEIQKSGIPAHVDIDVPANKDIYLATGVLDSATGKAGTLEIPLKLAATSTASSAHPN